MKRLLVLLVPCFVMAAGCDREDNDSWVSKKSYVTTVSPADVVVEVNCTCLCHDHEDNDGHDDHFVPPGHRR